GHVHRFSYDTLGRLIRDEDPVGGVTTLARTDTATSSTVTRTTALDHVTTYQTDVLPDGSVQQTTTDPSGAQTVALIGMNGAQTAAYPEGTRLTLVRGPDPRWGMQAPMLQTMTQTTPSGTQRTLPVQRTTTLADPNNPFSLQTLTTKLARNGQTF